MGQTESTTSDYKTQYWQRNIKDLFTSVRILDPFDFSVDFIIPVTHTSEHEKHIAYALISKKGEVQMLLHNSLEISLTEDFGVEITSACRFGIDSFLLASNASKIFLVTYMYDKFENMNIQ